MKRVKIPVYLFALGLAGCMTGNDGGPSEPAIPRLSMGTYQQQRTEIWTQANHGVNATVILKAQLELRSDSTYLMQGYITSADLKLTDFLLLEDKGTFRQEGYKLVLSNIIEREALNLSTGQMSAWVVPSSGSRDSSTLRNITSSTFQELEENTGIWYTWSKL